MARSIWGLLLWRGLGLLCYLAGLLLFVLVGLDVYLSAPERSFENVTTLHVVPLGLSILLLLLGGVFMQKFGGGFAGGIGAAGAQFGMPGGAGLLGDGTEQTRLEELGYRVSSGSGDNDGSFAYEDGEVYAICTECGTKNEQGYRYCNSCSTKLPD